MSEPDKKPKVTSGTGGTSVAASSSPSLREFAAAAHAEDQKSKQAKILEQELPKFAALLKTFGQDIAPTSLRVTIDGITLEWRRQYKDVVIITIIEGGRELQSQSINTVAELHEVLTNPKKLMPGYVKPK